MKALDRSKAYVLAWAADGAGGDRVSRKEPPLHLLEKMGRGRLAIVTSALCLLPALLVKRGEKTWTGPFSIATGDAAFDAEAGPELEQQARANFEAFLKATSEELDAAIVLYEAHLRFCGVQVDAGSIH